MASFHLADEQQNETCDNQTEAHEPVVAEHEQRTRSDATEGHEACSSHGEENVLAADFNSKIALDDPPAAEVSTDVASVASSKRAGLTLELVGLAHDEPEVGCEFQMPCAMEEAAAPDAPACISDECSHEQARAEVEQLSAEEPTSLHEETMSEESVVICAVLEDPFATDPLESDASAASREDEVVTSASAMDSGETRLPRQNSSVRPLPPPQVPPSTSEVGVPSRALMSGRPSSMPPALQPLQQKQPPMPAYRGAMKRSLPPPPALVMPSGPPSLPALRAISTLPPAPARGSIRPPSSTMRPPPAIPSMRSAPRPPRSSAPALMSDEVFFVPPSIVRPSQAPPSSVFEELESAPPSALLREISLSELRRSPLDVPPAPMAPAVVVEQNNGWGTKATIGLVLLGVLAGSSLSNWYQQRSLQDAGGTVACEIPTSAPAATQHASSESQLTTTQHATASITTPQPAVTQPTTQLAAVAAAMAEPAATAQVAAVVAKAEDVPKSNAVVAAVTAQSPAERVPAVTHSQASTASASRGGMWSKSLETRRSERVGEVELVLPQAKQAADEHEPAAPTLADLKAPEAAAPAAAEKDSAEPPAPKLYARELSETPPPAAPAVSLDMQRAREVMSQAAAAAAAACGQGQPGTARVSVTFAPSGRSTGVGVQANAFAGTTVGSCIATHFRNLSVEPFEGQAKSLSISVSIR